MRPFSRGQGAIEYLMSYGWAILVVMVVGLAMWQLGMFNMGVSPTTSIGFQSLKPILATCKVAPSAVTRLAYGTLEHGFVCQFINSAGTDISVTDISIWLNGSNGNGLCREVGAGTNLYLPLSQIPSTDWSQISKGCYSGGTCDPITLVTGITHNQTGNYPISSLNVPKDSTFSVALSTILGGSGCSWCSCYQIPTGQPFKAYVDITYDVNLGGVTSTKHSIGTINLASG